MAVTNGYCTVAELRDHLGDSGSKLDIDLLERAINGTSRAIDDYTGRRFWQDSTVQTRSYKVWDPYIAWVDDISTATGLIVKTDGTGDYLWSTTWLSTDYELEPDNADVNGKPWWRIVAAGSQTFPVSRRRKTLQITARFGWASIPDQINEAAILKAASLFKRKDAVLGVVSFADFGPMRISRKDHDVVELIGNYVRSPMGGM